MIQNVSPSLISIMEKYCVKQTISKFDLARSFILDLTPRSKIEAEFEPKLWAELIADQPATAKAKYHKEIESICDHLFGAVTVIATVRRRNKDKNVLEQQLDRGHLADLLCKINQQEIVCGLGCGGPHKYDLTKWESDEYQLPRILKDTLDDMLEKFRSRNRCMTNLYTIGIQQYMAEIRIYMMEKRDVYRFHLLKSFNLPLSHSSYGNLRLALSWAWNIKGLVEKLSFELDDRAFVSSRTPERDPPDEMKTDVMPDRSKKKKKV
ncbi:hypothetical protein Glove_421g114 [Diversispora epigaea]|uniref:Uncharacterized protein n=1 Tax=Diversispora epigaea TaxID=1348612 RepID=A0A397GZ82_9GLOM|nr:hypothetical protein Glove_421g114 [Diversispora epigaea]